MSWTLARYGMSLTRISCPPRQLEPCSRCESLAKKSITVVHTHLCTVEKKLGVKERFFLGCITVSLLLTCLQHFRAIFVACITVLKAATITERGLDVFRQPFSQQYVVRSCGLDLWQLIWMEILLPVIKMYISENPVGFADPPSTIIFTDFCVPSAQPF